MASYLLHQWYFQIKDGTPADNDHLTDLKISPYNDPILVEFIVNYFTYQDGHSKR
jgi:hypothetical protein